MIIVSGTKNILIKTTFVTDKTKSAVTVLEKYFLITDYGLQYPLSITKSPFRLLCTSKNIQRKRK